MRGVVGWAWRVVSLLLYDSSMIEQTGGGEGENCGLTEAHAYRIRACPDGRWRDYGVLCTSGALASLRTVVLYRYCTYRSYRTLIHVPEGFSVGGVLGSRWQGVRDCERTGSTGFFRLSLAHIRPSVISTTAYMNLILHGSHRYRLSHHYHHLSYRIPHAG